MSTASPPTTSAASAAILATLSERLGDGVFSVARFRDNIRIHVPASRLVEVMTALKTEGGCAMLSEVGAADYLGYPGRTRHRFEVHYVLRNLDSGGFVVVKAGLDDPDPTIASMTPIWPGADWMEREVFDMYGIRFEGHPDLRRILMPDEFAAYPLRKDYPLRGRGERHNFPRLTREES